MTPAAPRKRMGRRHVIEWKGQLVNRVQIGFDKAVADTAWQTRLGRHGLEGNVTPHTLRQTAAIIGERKHTTPLILQSTAYAASRRQRVSNRSFYEWSQ